MSTLYLAVDWMAMATPQTGKSVTTVNSCAGVGSQGY